MLAIYFAVGVLAADCGSEAAATNCDGANCEAVGSTKVCIQCTAGNVPINGICKPKGDPTVSTAGCTKGSDPLDGNSKTCGKCEGDTYFLYKGGCYSTSDATGKILCATATSGACTQGAEGYFAIPEASSTGESVVKCDDSATGIQISTGTYKGVADCAVCTAPRKGTSSGDQQIAICNKCTGDKIVKTADGATSCIDESACNNGFFVETTANGSTSSKVCTACTDDNCDVCAAFGAKKCSKCKTSGEKIYLQKEADSQTGTCIEKASCTGTNYIDEAAKACNTCASAGTTDCTTCEKGADGAVVCKTCGSQKKIRPDKKGCIDACPPDVSTEKNGVCECVEGYAPSADGSSCTSSSANRSALSTGAIAGISVAAVVVVGGLVGFLCWWFICRGKA
ncbi:Variant-specific surface protein [Giardia duodenalis]|uniref:Variant-specific surface protein n=1 Tax=Giardia intestinalis TaxID=5741 RepID=V6TU26_GIAIN|nr:Variant-specific surface protein [Giardia intestinalis]